MNFSPNSYYSIRPKETIQYVIRKRILIYEIELEYILITIYSKGALGMSKNTILKGTLILTVAGLATRFIGFFYKIFLSKALGAELLGVYQLVFPVYGICFTIYASGIQTGISKLVAEEVGRGNYKGAKKILRIGLLASFSIALALSFLVYQNSDYIATRILLEASSSSSLRVLAIVFPFCGITSCINGYYYGLKRAGVPATTQLLEQVVRVAIVYYLAMKLGNGNVAATCELAVFGLVIGEVASNIYNILSLLIIKPVPKENNRKEKYTYNDSSRHALKQLSKISVPLTANRLLISLLHSFEAILIPSLLKRAGLSSTEALSIYGILTGMTLPFLLFPSTITNSLSVLLLPTISEASAKDNKSLISHTISVSLKYSLILGIFSTGIFIFFGNPLGMAVFHEPTAGSYLVVLSWLCPFLYMTTTMSSILNGLGKAHLTFLNSIIGLTLRIVLMVILIPKQGIVGYLNSLLVSQLLLAALDTIFTYKSISFSFDAVNSIVKPALVIACSASFFYQLYCFIHAKTQLNNIILILMSCAVISIVYVIILFMLKAIKTGEWKS